MAVVSAMQNSNYFLLIAGKNHVTRLSLRHVCPMEEPMPRSVLLGCPKICAFLRPLVAITLEHPPERHFGLPDSQIVRSSSGSQHESRNCRQRHPRGSPLAPRQGQVLRARNSLRPSLIRVVRREKIERTKRKIGIAAARKAIILKIILSALLRGSCCPFHDSK